MGRVSVWTSFYHFHFQFSFLFFSLFSFWIVTLWFIFMPLPCAQYIFEILAWRDALFVLIPEWILGWSRSRERGTAYLKLNRFHIGYDPWMNSTFMICRSILSSYQTKQSQLNSIVHAIPSVFSTNITTKTSPSEERDHQFSHTASGNTFLIIAQCCNAP